MGVSSSGRLAVTAALAALVGALGCGGTSDGPGTTGPWVLPVGDGTLVVAGEGGLGIARPTTAADRVQALTDYFRDHPGLFGLPGSAADPPDFAPAAREERVEGPDGSAWTLVTLHQTWMGAPVVDEVQMGAFLAAPGGDLLRRVRGWLRDPGTLPHPPEPGTDPPDRVLPAVDVLIREHGLSYDRTTVGDTPVVSAAHGIAGYLVSQFRPTATGSFERFRAIVDPRDLRSVVLEHRTPCDDFHALPDGVEVLEQAVPPFFPPSLVGIRVIRIHAVRLSDGDGSNQAPITRAQVRKWVDAANQVWFPQAGILFAFDDAPGSADFEDWKATLLNSVPDDDDQDHTYQTVGNVWSLLFHHTKLVVFFRARGGGGWSWGPTSTFFVSMPSYTNTGIDKPGDGGVISNDTLLSHEIGHYMGLAHTFGGSSCAAASPANGDGDAGGQDGTTPDDDVLDTSPDMTDTCYPTPSLTCVGGTVSWNGWTWDPPWTNVMSYHDCLPEELTDGQVDAIDRTLQHPVRAEIVQ